MSIENISEGLGSHQIQKGDLNSKQKTRSKEKEETSSKIRQDRVEISEDAQRLMRQSSADRQLQKVEEESAESKHREDTNNLLPRIQTDSSERQETIKKIMESFTKENGEFLSLGPIKVDAEVRWTKIQEVGRRIEAHFYQRKDVVNAIIDKLLNL